MHSRRLSTIFRY